MRYFAAFALLLLTFVTACAVPVAAGLDENDANGIVVALDRASIGASKDVDPSVEGKFRVMVAQADVPGALSAMRDEELPRPHHAGVLEATGKGSLVPSEAAEHAQLVAGVAGDLSRTLQAVDGVLVARVHLSVPASDPLHADKTSRPSASVLLEHRGPTPPLSVDSVQRLVAGGVQGLLPTDVAVVLVARPAPPLQQGDRLGHVGPIAVARTSMRLLQGALVALFALVALLAAATLFLYSRLARARAAAPAPSPSSSSSGSRGSQATKG